MTRKITKAAVRIKKGLQERLYLGNLNAKRDWGYAPEFVEAMWLMMQQDIPEDFVIATNETHTVREFVEFAFRNLGVNIIWKGERENEKGYDKASGKCIVEIDPKYYRPTEVDILIGDYSKAKSLLGWKPKVTFNELVKLMVDSDLHEMKEG